MSPANLSRLKLFASACVLTMIHCIIFSCIVTSSHGGLLSSYLRTKNSYYSIQSVNKVSEESLSQINSNEIDNDNDAVRHNLLETTSYEDCGSTAKIKSLSLSPCSNKRRSFPMTDRDGITSDICEIKRGSTATFALSFVPKANATQLKAVIHGIIDYVPIPFPCPEPDACENSGISCPVIAGRKYDYSLSAPIKDSYPKMKLWVKGQIEDGDGKNVICVKMHVHII